MKRWLSIAALVWLLDQATKVAALHYLAGAPVELAPFLNLVLVFNTGAAFSFLSAAGGWQNAFFAAVAAIAAVVIVVLLRRLGPGERMLALALALVLGGALGNLADRLVHGHVVDFIDLHYAGWHWPTFNIADSAISAGALLFVLDSFGVKFRRGRS
jgi:signal peptidase II